MSEHSKQSTFRSRASVSRPAATSAADQYRGAERQRSPLLRRWSVADLIAEAAARTTATDGCPAV
jgi:hypothetical protein